MAMNAPTPRQPKPPQPETPVPDAGHIPITEEMDSARWTLPPLAPVLVALGIVAAIVAIFSYTSRDIVANGAITVVNSVEQPGGNAVLVAVHARLANTSDKTLLVKRLSASVSTTHGDFSDDAASAEDVPRYLQGYPALAQPEARPLHAQQQIAPHSEIQGVFVVSFPISKQDFDQRKSLAVNFVFYDHRPVELKQ